MEAAEQPLPKWWGILSREDQFILRKYGEATAEFSAGSKPALVVVDVNAEYVGPDEPVADAQDWSRKACGENAWQTIPNIVSILTAFRSSRREIVHARPDERTELLGAASRAANYADSFSAWEHREPSLGELLASVSPREGELVVAKPRSSAFAGTPLLQHLVSKRVDELVVVGCTTSGCIRATAMEAHALGFPVTVVEDACFDRVELLHDVAVLEIELKYGRILDTDDIVANVGVGAG